MGQNPTEWRRDDEFNFPDGSQWYVENVDVDPSGKRVRIEFVSNDAPAKEEDAPREYDPATFCETTVPEEWINDGR